MNFAPFVALFLSATVITAVGLAQAGDPPEGERGYRCAIARYNASPTQPSSTLATFHVTASERIVLGLGSRIQRETTAEETRVIGQGREQLRWRVTVAAEAITVEVADHEGQVIALSAADAGSSIRVAVPGARTVLTCAPLSISESLELGNGMGAFQRPIILRPSSMNRIEELMPAPPRSMQGTIRLERSLWESVTPEQWRLFLANEAMGSDGDLRAGLKILRDNHGQSLLNEVIEGFKSESPGLYRRIQALLPTLDRENQTLIS